jgi:hypothetical protein
MEPMTTEFLTMPPAIGYILVLLMLMIFAVGVISYREYRRWNISGETEISRRELRQIRKVYAKNALISRWTKQRRGYVIPVRARIYKSVDFCYAYIKNRLNMDEIESIHYGRHDIMTPHTVDVNGADTIHDILKWPYIVVIPKEKIESKKVI